MTELVLPHIVTVNQDSLSITRFEVQGSSTASHVSLAATFFPAVTVKAIRLLVDGAQFSTSSCTPSSLPASGVETVQCTDFGNLGSHHVAKLLVRFSSAAAGAVQVSGSASYAESGTDNQGGPNGTKNDQQFAKPDSATFVSATTLSAGGKCTDGANTVTGSDSLLSALVSYPGGSDTLSLCSPASATVTPSNSSVIRSEVASIELTPQTTPGYAVVKLDFTPLPPNTTVKKLVLLEDTAVPPAAPFTTFITVPDGCDSTTGLPPNPGIPSPGSTDSSVPAHKNDLCIDSRASLPKGGGELVLHLLGSGGDPKVGAG